MTLQEMFDKAYMGLYSQGFKKCNNSVHCVYSDGKGNHCAWGWVDPTLGADVTGRVYSLYQSGVGIAGTLNEGQLNFASDLQGAHDASCTPKHMKRLLNNLAQQYNLLVPILLERRYK